MSTQVQTTADALNLLAPHGKHLKHEELQALFLDATGTLLQHRVLSQGTANQTFLCVRTVLATALRMNAQGIILAHNHPNGNPEPSILDVRATYRFKEGARLVGVALVDHLIITDTDHRSMRAMGILPP